MVERLAEGRTAGRAPGAAVYVDIVGFTALGDALAGAGPPGAEAVASTVQSVMIPIVEAVHRQHGFVASFPGDAVLALFPAEERLAAPGRRAIEAAEAMQASICALGPQRAPYGPVQIAARVGVGAGEFSWTVLSAGERRTFAIAGSAPAAAVEAEQHAGPGRVNSHPTIEQPLPLGGSRQATGPVTESDLHRLARGFVGPDLVSDLGAGEFRPVTTAFIETPVNDLESVVTNVFDLQNRFGGHLDPVEIGDKGCVVRLVWGAPIRHEGDDARCLAFVHELRRRHRRVRIGVTTGTAFTGFVGTTQRMGYVTYGSHVNLAARLMSAAEPGQILVAGALTDLASASYVLQLEGERRFKGFARPIAVATVAEHRDPVPDEAGYVGREPELAALEEFVRHGSGLGLVAGPPGIGKSSLVAQVRQRAADLRWISAAADPVWREPFQPLRRVVADLLGQTSHASRSDNELRLLAGLESLGLSEHRIQLGALVDLFWPESAAVLADRAARRGAVLAAVTALLAAVCARQRVVLQIDDLHWSDQETIACLPELVASLCEAPFVLVATSRDEAAVDLAPSLALWLDELSETGLGLLAERVVGGPLAWPTVTWLARRTSGNPFFAQQVLLHLRERRQLLPGPTGWVLGPGGVAVPPSVGAVVVARLDGLPRPLRSIAKSAAVLGARFELAELRALAGRAEGPELDALVAQGTDVGLWRRSGTVIEFVHALVRDAVYETLLVVARSRLNLLAVAVIEELYADDLGPHLHRLAHHLVAAGDPVAARRRERQAADRALGLGAFHEAGAYATAGLQLEVGDQVVAEEATQDELELWLALASSRLMTVGQSAAETKQAYDRAAELAGEAAETRAGFRALFGLRTFYLFRGDHVRALEMAERSLVIAERIGTADVLEQAHLMVGNSRFWVGDLDEAQAHLDIVLGADVDVRPDVHRAGFAQHPRSTAVLPAALTAWLRGDRVGALRIAETAATTAVDPFGITMSQQTIGYLHCLNGQVDAAHRAASAMLELAVKHNFGMYAETARLQLGWVRARLGAPDDGLREMVEAQQRMLADGTRGGNSLRVVLLADASLTAGRYDSGLTLAEEGLIDATQRRELAFLGVLARLRDDLAAGQSPDRPTNDAHRREHLDEHAAL